MESLPSINHSQEKHEEVPNTEDRAPEKLLSVDTSPEPEEDNGNENSGRFEVSNEEDEWEEVPSPFAKFKS